MRNSNSMSSMSKVYQFPNHWNWFVDQLIPTYVKKTYSPKESWKSKPFSKEDAFFFYKGIEELSELFTEERPSRLPTYFNHPKNRSAYLLYFLPLQAAKFYHLFETQTKAIDSLIQHGKKTGTIQVADLGAGPGTASIALLFYLLAHHSKSLESFPPIHFYWFDTCRTIMLDGVNLIEEIEKEYPVLSGKIKITLEVEPWWKSTQKLPQELSLILMGHLLNEAQVNIGPSKPKPTQASLEQIDTEEVEKLERPSLDPTWEKILERSKGAGLLCIEPATRKNSHTLSQLRDRIFESQTLPESPSSIWGPCLHAGKCPLATGRDWCHFSEPLKIPGKWFKEFSKALAAEKEYIKFCYLWLASADYPAPVLTKKNPDLRRVISDPLRGQKGQPSSVLLCEPEQPGRLILKPQEKIWRGEIINKPKTWYKVRNK